MVILAALVLAFKVATWAIAAGLDGRTVYHVHESGHIVGHATPYPARLWAVIRGTSTRDYACPLNPSPIEREWTTWPF